MKLILFPSPPKSIDDYWRLEFELAKIADGLRLTREQLIEDAHLMPHCIHEQVVDIIDEQSCILGEIR